MKKILLQLTFVLLSLNLAAQIPTTGLIALWTFPGNANDQSGNGRNGTVTGATLTTDRFGNANNAYSFNGSSNYISVPDHPSLRLNNTDYSISTWINAVSFPATPTAIISKRTGSGQKGYVLNIAGGASVPHYLNFNISGSVDPKVVSHHVVTTNTWHHIVLIYVLSTQRMKIYLDGSLDADTTGFPSPNALTAAAMIIGKDSASNGYYFNGKMDDIAIYNRAVTPAEVQQLFLATVGINNVTEKATVEIFPNPVKDYFTITNLQQGEIKIYNPLGGLVKSAAINRDNFDVQVSELPESVYYIQITDKNRNVIVKKIIKN